MGKVITTGVLDETTLPQQFLASGIESAHWIVYSVVALITTSTGNGTRDVTLKVDWDSGNDFGYRLNISDSTKSVTHMLALLPDTNWISQTGLVYPATFNYIESQDAAPAVSVVRAIRLAYPLRIRNGKIRIEGTIISGDDFDFIIHYEEEREAAS